MNAEPAKRRLVPVRTLLFLLVAIAALPPLVFAGIFLSYYSESQQTQAEGDLTVATNSVARAIDAKFALALATLKTLKNSYLLQRGELAAFETRMANTSDELNLAFALFDGTGRQIAATAPPGRPKAPSLDLRPHVPAILEKGTYFSDVNPGADGQEPFGFVAVTADSKGERLILVTFLSSRDFADVIGQQTVADNWIVSIVDRTGTHIRRSRLNERFAGRPLVPELVKHMAAGRSGILLTTSLEGIPLISSVSYAPLSGWATAIGLPREELNAPFRQSLFSLTIIGVLVIATALLLAVMLARLLNRGFVRLGDTARSLDRGEIVEPQPAPIREVDDVIATMAEVSRNLVARGRALAELNSSLESQVADRTAELVDEMKRRTESETKLRQIQRIEAIGKLTGGIAHDFNNMLAVIISALSLLQRHLQRGDINVQKYVDAAMQGADNAANLTRRLLAFSRQLPLAPESVDCNKLIAGTSEMLKRLIPEHIEIETILAGGLWRTHIDAPGLENAIVNIAVNARDAMPDGGKLTIETSNAHLDEAYTANAPDVVAGQYVMIAITDTGTGIPADMLDKVFEPFVTTKPTGQGTGLGLSQVHGFIKQSNGHVRIYSEMGHGTNVKLYLPRLTTEPASIAANAGIPPGANQTEHGETILVVEDEAAVRLGAVAMLEELGYTVLEADGGDAALRLIDAHPEIQLVLTDVVMPGMNGRQLADEARKRRPDLRILFTTGYTRNAIVHQGTLDPGVQLIPKPYTLETLARKVAQMLARQG